MRYEIVMLSPIGGYNTKTEQFEFDLEEDDKILEFRFTKHKEFIDRIRVLRKVKKETPP